MLDFIQQAAGKLGLSEGATEAATGGVLDFIKKNADAGDFDSLLGAVPGAKEMLGKAPSGEAKGGGGLLGAALGAIGGGGSALSLAAVIKSAGLDLDKTGGFISMLIGYLKEKAGADLIGKLLGNIPDLKKLLG